MEALARFALAVAIGVLILVAIRAALVAAGMPELFATLAAIVATVSIIEPRSYFRSWLRRRRPLARGRDRRDGGVST